jgi:hypothetical protein
MTAAPVSPRDENFLRGVQNALYVFQMIEEGLKILIGLSYEVIQASAPPPVAFHFKKEEINDAALGTLRKMYAKVSNNEALAKEISSIISWRDYCAHRAFQVEFMSRMDAQRESEKDHAGLIKATEASLEILQALGEEIKAVRQVHPQRNHQS